MRSEGISPMDQPDTAGRPPRGAVESIVANCRPQPAIPAVLVFFLAVLLPMATAGGEAAPGWHDWLIPVGIVASCGLAMAAGFCSFFPQAVWLVLAGWAYRIAEAAGLPAYNRYLLAAGMLSAVVMLVVQAWRVQTRRFVPTVQQAGSDSQVID